MFSRFGRALLGLHDQSVLVKGVGASLVRLKMQAFVISAALAGLAGLIFAARLNTATPKAGLGFELDVIAACFIGGASASGGAARVIVLIWQ